LFQAEGDKLFSSAFFVDFQNHYAGKIAGNEIRFIMQDDRGNPPRFFMAMKDDPSA
jgi:hypothetical protein